MQEKQNKPDEKQNKVIKLNKMQKDFCKYYVEFGNARKAARKAGYKESTVRSDSYKWTEREDYQYYIDKLEKQTYSLEKYIEDLNEATKIAFETKNPVTAIKIIELKGKAFGFDKFTKTDNNGYLKETVKTDLLEEKDVSRYEELLDKLEQKRQQKNSDENNTE